MTIRAKNNGHLAEDRAEVHLRDIYDFVQKSKYGTFFDFLVKKGTTDILIEVKWVECRYKSVNIYLKWKQAMRLFNAKDFLLYILTPKGNFFISPEKVLKYAHVHYNFLNPHEKNILIRATLADEQFVVMEPQKCLYCDGKLDIYLK
jgi:hypothetical protein